MRYSVATFEIDTVQFEISRDTIPVAVEPKVFDLIVYLIEHRERLVTRDELFEKIWQGREVSDTTLSNSIKSARKILGDSGELQTIIKTIRGRGYQFIALVTPLDTETNVRSEATVSAPQNSHPSQPAIKSQAVAKSHINPLSAQSTKRYRLFSFSLVVMMIIVIAVWRLNQASGTSDKLAERPYILVTPFEVIGEQKEEWQPFADQMTRDVIRNLRKISGLNVIPQSSAFTFRNNKVHAHIKEQLPEVSYVLSASVSVWDDSRIQVIPELEDLNTSQLVWDHEFESRIDDTTFFSIKKKIATSLSDSLKVAILEEEKSSLGDLPTNNLSAYELYVKGQQQRDVFTHSSLLQAIALYSQAIELDPQFEAAYVAKADAYRIIMAYFDVPSEALPKVTQAVAETLNINPASAEARSSLGLAYVLAWRWQDAWELLNQAKALNPNLALTEVGFALYYSGLGDVEGVKISLARANQLDPLNIELADWGHWSLAMIGEVDAAVKWGKEKIQLHPGVGMIYSGASVSATLSGDHQRAISLAKQGVELEVGSPYPVLALAQAYGYAGQLEKVPALIKQAEQFESYLCDYETAVTYLMMDEVDKSFEHFNKAVVNRSNCLVFTRNDPRLNPLRNDKRYEALLMRVGLDDKSLAQYLR